MINAKHRRAGTTPLVIPHCESDRFAVILFNNQGIKLEKVNTDSTVPLKFLCHKGWRSQKAVENAIKQLDRLITEGRKPVILYIWLGTCDITERISQSKGYIDKRYKNLGDATDKILVQYNRIKDFAFLHILRQSIIRTEGIENQKSFWKQTSSSNRKLSH
ncbi:unnamed protein product [Mytilus coruscus]|uniref:Uncharacterized protein n=1 Tax=Mytilus coruscus TaxID=42192 RepID=A0A6J8BMB3_MYTCO|nr:unnamed protein product [Mytilus coruscus]